MSDRAQALADKFADAHKTAVAAVEGVSDERWRETCVDEERPVGVVAYHVAASYASTFGVAQMAATGEPLPPVSWEMIHDMNAKQAEEQKDCTKAETLELMQEQGARITSEIAKLTDEQLDQTFVLQAFSPDEITVEYLVNMLVIGHIGIHVPSINGTAA